MIPKIIHQTFINQECLNECKTLKYCQNELKKLHSDFTYKFYNDSDDIHYYIKNNFPEEYYVAFSKLPKKIMKIDFFRYFLMYNEGGIYCDLDYLFFKKYDILDKNCVLMNEWNNKNYITNCIFASEPKHEFWKQLIDNIFIYEKTPKLLNNNILQVSGPFFISKIYNESYINNSSIFVCESNIFTPNSFDIIKRNIINELCNKNESKYDSCTIIDHPDIVKFLKNNQNSYGIHLCSSSWTNKQVKKLRSRFYKLL